VLIAANSSILPSEDFRLILEYWVVKIEIAFLDNATFWEIHHELAIILAFILDKSEFK